MRGDPMSVTKEFAVKIDTELSSWYDKRWNLVSDLESAIDSVTFYEKYYPTSVEKIDEGIKKIEKIESEINKVNVEIIKLNAIYNQDPWTRAFLVINSNGHVHSSMDCSTCFATTRYNCAPTASGEFLTYKEGKWTRVIKTERSAVTEWFNLQWTIEREIVTHYYNGEAHSAESIQKQKDEIAFAQEIADLIVRNLAEKNGVSFDQQLKILNNKYQKRRAS